jgi:hypothetical protein
MNCDNIAEEILGVGLARHISPLRNLSGLFPPNPVQSMLTDGHGLSEAPTRSRTALGSMDAAVATNARASDEIASIDKLGLCAVGIPNDSLCGLHS